MAVTTLRLTGGAKTLCVPLKCHKCHSPPLLGEMQEHSNFLCCSAVFVPALAAAGICQKPCETISGLSHGRESPWLHGLSPQPVPVQEQGKDAPGSIENCSSSLGSTEQGKATDSCFLMNGIATRLKKGEMEPCRGCLNTFSLSFLFPHLL